MKSAQQLDRLVEMDHYRKYELVKEDDVMSYIREYFLTQTMEHDAGTSFARFHLYIPNVKQLPYHGNNKLFYLKMTTPRGTPLYIWSFSFPNMTARMINNLPQRKNPFRGREPQNISTWKNQQIFGKKKPQQHEQQEQQQQIRSFHCIVS